MLNHNNKFYKNKLMYSLNNNIKSHPNNIKSHPNNIKSHPDNIKCRPNKIIFINKIIFAIRFLNIF